MFLETLCQCPEVCVTYIPPETICFSVLITWDHCSQNSWLGCVGFVVVVVCSIQAVWAPTPNPVKVDLQLPFRRGKLLSPMKDRLRQVTLLTDSYLPHPSLWEKCLIFFQGYSPTPFIEFQLYTQTIHFLVLLDPYTLPSTPLSPWKSNALGFQGPTDTRSPSIAVSINISLPLWIQDLLFLTPKAFPSLLVSSTMHFKNYFEYLVQCF